MSRTVLLTLLVALPSLTGCFYSREIAHVRRDIERQYPEARFERQVVVNAGPVLLRLSKWITRRVDDEDARMAADYLEEVRRVKVGVYRTEHLPDLEKLDLPALRRFQREGWDVAVRVRDADEAVWVLYRENRYTVRDMYVLVLSDDELVIASIEGRLDRLLQKAIEDHASVSEWVDWND
jgi:hypothetical protein